MLSGFDDDDAFWTTCPRGYSKQIFLRNWQKENRAHDQDKTKKKRRIEKTWFREEKASGLWGPNGDRVYKAWSALHESEIEQFVLKLERRVDAVLSRMEYELSGK